MVIYLKEIQQILNKFNKIVLKEIYNIGNYLIINYIIRLTLNILIIKKMGYHMPKKHKWIKD